MKKYLFLTVLSILFVGCLSSNKMSKQTQIWQTIMTKQITTEIDSNIIKATYNDGTTLYYRILDNFGNVALTWDRTNRNTFIANSSYHGDIEIPAFVTVGNNNEFIFYVREIDEHTFCHSKDLKSIKIPYSIIRININAFSECNNLEKIEVDDNNLMYQDIDGVLFTKDTTMLINFPAQKQISDYTLPEETKFICPEAFMNNNYIRSIKIGKNTTIISDYAFKNCTNLDIVALGPNVRIIGQEAFANCKKINRIFSANYFPPHNCPIVFDKDIYNNCTVVIPMGMKLRYQNTLEWKDFVNFHETHINILKLIFNEPKDIRLD